LSKYTRIASQNSKEMSIERNFSNEELVLKFDLRFKIASILHKGRKIEEFCISPLTFEHELVLKDSRILFCLKNQSDGYVVNKFRIRFETVQAMNDFCSLIGNYIKLHQYDEWRKNPFCLALLDSSVTKSQLLSSAPEVQFIHDQSNYHIDDLLENSQDHNENLSYFNKLNDSTYSSTNNALNISDVNKHDVEVQTVETGESINANPTVNIYIENLIPKDAVEKLIKLFTTKNPPRKGNCKGSNMSESKPTSKKVTRKPRMPGSVWDNLAYASYFRDRSTPKDRKASRYSLRGIDLTDEITSIVKQEI